MRGYGFKTKSRRQDRRYAEPDLRLMSRPPASALEASWGKVEARVTAWKSLVRESDRQGLREGKLSEQRARQIEDEFLMLCSLLNHGFGEGSAASDDLRAAIGDRAQLELLPYLLLTRSGERWYSKPRGYAGDYLTIEWLYQNQPAGTGRLGPVLDRCFLNLPAAKAVRNRRGLLAEEIQQVLADHPDRQVRIASLACGPALELFDVFEELDDASRLAATLIDIDLHALAFVGDRRDDRGLRKQMELIHGNLVYLASGRKELALAEQDLIYSIGLIDYFDDRFVVKLLDWIYARLRPGGKVILGNFHPHNPSRFIMDHVLDWRLRHRTQDDMNRLFSSSAFGRECSRIQFEQEGINLFAECAKGILTGVLAGPGS